jgi:cell division septal protein FtsQ
VVKFHDIRRTREFGARREFYPRAKLAGVRRRLAAAAALTAGAFLAACVVYASVTSAPWRLGRYTVRGASYLTPREVLTAADLKAGDNLFWVNLARAEGKLCQHPRIRRASIRRRLPAEILVEVEERPAAAAMIINGTLYKVSSDGVILEPMAAGYEDVPILVGTRFRAAGGVSGKVVTRGEVRAALATVEALASVDPAWAAAVEYVDINERVAVLAAGRYRLRYGAALDELTAQRLRRVFEATRANGGVVTYDTRFGMDVIVTGGSNGVGGGAGGGAANGGAV